MFPAKKARNFLWDGGFFSLDENRTGGISVSGNETSFPSWNPSFISALHSALMQFAINLLVSSGAYIYFQDLFKYINKNINKKNPFHIVRRYKEKKKKKQILVGKKKYAYPIMASNKKMIRTRSPIPERVFVLDNVKVVCQILFQSIKGVRIRDVNSLLQHLRTERKVK